MDQDIRNKLRNVVTQCRKLLEDAISQELEGKYGIFARKDQVTADPNATLSHLTDEDQVSRRDILDHLAHIKARGFKPKESLDQLVREIAFTHLNRLCAYKMMEAREVYVGGQKFREAVSRGVNSNGVKFYLADHEDDERLYNTGHQDVAYRHFLDWLGGTLSEEIGVLFNPNDPANRLYPRQKTLDEILDLLNGGGIKAEETELREQWPKIWAQDETIGWVYQYFTPKELRDQARKESSAPRNSYELAFRNQFFTPRYVVEFLTDNTLGRIWYEMRKGDTQLKDQCRYLVRRPTEIFLKNGEQPPQDSDEGRDDLSQEDLLKLPVHIPHRPKKDPRELKILDPACGSGHFLLYCFDLLLTIYEEAYADPDLGPALQSDYPKLEDLQRDAPRLILAHNLHGIDIDLRASQIAALALWLRCQRAYQEMGLKKDRPKITRSNFVCAEPMPGEASMLKEFVGQLEPKVLGQVVEVIFDKMKLAGEAGSLLKIEEEIRDAVAEARKQWIRETAQATDRKGRPLLFTQAALNELDRTPEQQALFDLSDLTDAQFFENAETRVIEALRSYAEKAQSGQKLKKRLFTDDAVRGFAFVDLCQKRYDAVLMNPPFGQPTQAGFNFLRTEFAGAHNDIFCAFVRNAIRIAPHGRVGAITSRSFLVAPRQEQFRIQDILPRLDILVDFGLGVMDDAYVESAAYVLREPPVHSFTVFDLRSAAPNHAPLIKEGLDIVGSCIARSKWFDALPKRRILYAAPASLRQILNDLDTFEPTAGTAREGMKSFDNERFVRLWWEVPPQLIGKGYRWIRLVKGGGFSFFYSEVHLVLDWANDGEDLKRVNVSINGSTAQVRQASDYWYRPGATYSKRSVRGFSARILPADCIFTSNGPAVLPNPEWNPSLFIGWLNSTPIRALIHMQANFADYSTGVIKQLPWPFKVSNEYSDGVTEAVTNIINILEVVHASVEISPLFTGVPRSLAHTQVVSNVGSAVQVAIAECDRHVCASLGLGDMVWATEVLSESDGDSESAAVGEEDEDDSGPSNAAIDIVGYFVGVAFGRWDVRNVTSPNHQHERSDAFAPYPSYPPGLLQDSNGLPSTSEPTDYPIEVRWGGILTDDNGHTDDIVQVLRHIGEVVWESSAAVQEECICKESGVSKLRDYFRKPGKGGFWDDHISRYSKSRRKAPIYWLLQSSKKNYALWLYYHRLDNDLLFKALVNYVEPKIRLETSRLETLRSQKTTTGDSGKEAKRLAKDAERQEDFLSELRDFEDKLRRAANLHLEPDLNDGVVLNIAPLHELVPWKEARKYWDELLEGKYEWSAIGQQLRQKGLVA
ncbi:MAG: BREX-1 system adenine-specific DNA-methyltransferase PglX [Candidatus Competibacteraceae bacterium]